MSVWFTSDTHYSHTNIIKYCNRPFRDVNHMNIELALRWNERVKSGDTVYHLGDYGLGDIMNSLEYSKLLTGEKVLVLGNHDRPFMKRVKSSFGEWMSLYEQYFDRVVSWKGMSVDLYGYEFNLSHFPYTGDSHDDDRYEEFRIRDAGVPLIHGHTHFAGSPVSYSVEGTWQYHVGVDAHNYAPVPAMQVIDAYRLHLGKK